MYRGFGMESSYDLYSSVYQMTKCTYVIDTRKSLVYLLPNILLLPLAHCFPIYHSPLGFLRHVDISLRFRRIALFKVPSPPKGEDEMQSVASDKVVFGRSLVIGPVEKQSPH